MRLQHLHRKGSFNRMNREPFSQGQGTFSNDNSQWFRMV